MSGPVKIYDRPERKGPPMAIIAIVVAVLLIAAYFVYRAYSKPAAAQPHTTMAPIHLPIASATGEGPAWSTITLQSSSAMAA